MIKDIYPKKAQFCKTDSIEIEVRLDETIYKNPLVLVLNVFHLNEKIYSEKKDAKSKVVNFIFKLNAVKKEMQGFGVEAVLFYDEKEISRASTAFDVSEDWKYAPRYGFMSDFDKSQLNDEEDIAELSKYHINVVQFYDWMYRHHELIPPESDFTDAMGRGLSLDVVKQKIDYAHKYGMRALGYGAVYGSEKEFYSENKDMTYLQNDGKVMSFIDFIYMMDINRESPWHDHIIKEFDKAVEFGFDGIHMDQYGFPKEAIVKNKGKLKVRHLRKDFPELIEDTRKYIEDKNQEVDLIFNAVNNWPIDAVAGAPQDCMYIEVWSPNDTYEDLNRLILNAKRYSPQKQVILAAYLKSFSDTGDVQRKEAENGALLTMATIFSSGGFHLLLGEKNGILTEAYYPQYAVYTSRDFIARMRKYYDFIVRYEELLYSLDIIDNTLTYTGGINGEYVFKGADFSPKPEKNKVWTQVKEKSGLKIIQLVNFTEISDMNWNQGKESLPSVVKNIEVTALVVENVKGVFLASPDFNSGLSHELEYSVVPHGLGKAVQFIIPELQVWDVVYILVDENII